MTGAVATATISSVVAAHARSQPDALAIVEAANDFTLAWRDYDVRADAIAAMLAARHPRGARVAIHMPDGPDVHVAMLACERAGIVGVGIGPRAGAREVEHLVQRTGAVAVLRTLDDFDDDAESTGEPLAAPPPDRVITPDELWFLNSTSGTTGLPKCVMHNQARWFAFHDLAVANGELRADDVFMSLLPAPFGFGLWTAHFTPAILGAPCVLLSRFDAAAAIRAIEQHRVTVLGAVSTQFVMMLNSPAFVEHDLSSLRVMFTGGEMVPPERAELWERATGSQVLQFYGSNETGALSATTARDSDLVRLSTAGHVIDSMHVRLFDSDTGADVTAAGGPGIGACKGPVTCLGYYDDDQGNAALYTDDGWMRTGDLCTLDDDGVLRVVGRTSDFVIRGGKNLSAAVIEQECATMPGVLLAAVVAKPDDVFGERVCVFCAVDAGVSFTLDELRTHLEPRGVGKELWPEYLVLVEGDLPRSSGGKVAKAELRDRAMALSD
ncbi:MAG TPA: class I adenylate-forming enzyme family protein [Acidimicrobiia bacterium]